MNKHSGSPFNLRGVLTPSACVERTSRAHASRFSKDFSLHARYEYALGVHKAIDFNEGRRLKDGLLGVSGGE